MTSLLKIKKGPINKAQKDFLESLVPYILLSGAVAAGKAQPYTSVVYTPTGPKLMGSLSRGDILCHPKGGVSQVVQVHERGIREVYEIIFSDGSKVECCEDHLWDCWVSMVGHRKLRDTKELIRIYKETNQKIIIPLSKPVLFCDTQLPVDPYVLGVLLGDGSGALYSMYNPLKEELRRLGLVGLTSENKYIPSLYLNSQISARKELLQGLLDTDGTVDKNGKISFVSVSLKLAENVQYLVRSLGGVATLSKKYKTLKGKKFLCYEVYIRMPLSVKLFKLSRKESRRRPYNGGKSRHGKRIVSIKCVGHKKTRCITVSHQDGLYLTDDFTVTHNSYIGCLKGFMLGVKYPGNRGLIVRKEAASLYQSTIQTLLGQIIPKDMIVSYNQQRGELIHRTIDPQVNSKIVFCGLDKRADQTYPTKIGSTEYGWIFLDEGVEAEKGDWAMLSSRLRYKLPNASEAFNKIMPRQIFSATNPGGPNHWLYDFFFVNKGADRLAIIATPYDNPSLPKEYLKKLEGSLSGVEKERLLLGKWVQAEGIIYSGFSYTHHVKKDTNFLPLGDYQELIVGADSNYPLPRASVLVGVRGDGSKDVLDEFYRTSAPVEELCDWLRGIAEKAKRTVQVYHDPSDPSAIAKIDMIPGVICDKADNKVLPGISEVARHFDNGLLRIGEHCANLIKELQGYRWKVKKEGEAPEKRDDHLCDSLRYALASVKVGSLDMKPIYFTKLS